MNNSLDKISELDQKSGRYDETENPMIKGELNECTKREPTIELKDTKYICSNIGKGIFSAITNDWDNATIYAELWGDATNLKGEFFLHKKKHFFEVNDEAFDDFEDLRMITYDGKAYWNSIKFTIKSCGKFSVEYSYDKSLEYTNITKE
jgi:hypothetical protein